MCEFGDHIFNDFLPFVSKRDVIIHLLTDDLKLRYINLTHGEILA